MGTLSTQPELSINHFSHPHPLQLSNLQPQQTLNLASCSGCKLSVAGWIYICTSCNYILHIKCSQMPQQITHPFDQNHVLSLLPNPIYPDGLFNCDACKKNDNGFSYHCKDCNIDLHITCASMPLMLTHQSHHHQLDLTFSPPYHNKSFSCDICRNVGFNHWLYRCNLCGFDAHLNCAATKPNQIPIQQIQMHQYQTTRAAPQTHVLGTQYTARPPLQNYMPNNSMNFANPCVYGPVAAPVGRTGQANGFLNQAIEGLVGNGGGGGGGGGGGNLLQALMGDGSGAGNLLQAVMGGGGGGGNLLQLLTSGGGNGGGLDVFGGNGGVMDLDLNQEPLDPPVDSVLGLGSLLNELETTHGQIEERIRQLEAVTARARLRQRWRQGRNPPETINNSTDSTIDTIASTGGEVGVHNGEYSMAAQERTVHCGKSCKSDRTHLVAKALELDTVVKRVPYVYSYAKECPVCKGEVIDTNITPIYGNGNNTHVSELESGLKVPPRPPAHRIESVRQRRINRGVSHVPEALRRIRTGIGAIGERPQRQDIDGASDSSNRTNISASQVPTSELLPSTEAGGSRLHSRQFSRVLSERAASLSSISSALNNAERIVVDLEYIQERLLRRSHAQFLPVDGRDSFTSDAAIIQLEQEAVNSTAEINSRVPLPSSSIRTDLSAAPVVQLENLTTDTGIEINLTVPRPSSSRRRSSVSRASDVENGVSREHRRRRLR
ncbi:hypothetical protein F0562_014553 [Nyssa sinensis]|uniref:Zinc finger PHD-type domain-containing protein n=1 Tax=Nyssa sinensis TaxID=561372 RepID=A0A5J4ZT16_9ASTE|nr:hypothetical protein F0562_014553 [Nyssa sinensis]